MHPHFALVIESLEPTFQRLMQMEPVRFSSLPKGMPDSGIYLFSEGARHLYVGRSRTIRKRLGGHCRPGATHRMAAFAFRLARETTGRLVATYKTEGSRASLMEDLHFRSLLTQRRRAFEKWMCDLLQKPILFDRRSSKSTPRFRYRRHITILTHISAALRLQARMNHTHRRPCL